MRVIYGAWSSIFSFLFWIAQQALWGGVHLSNLSLLSGNCGFLKKKK